MAEYFTCIHGTGGRDRYEVYEVKTTPKCKRCGKTEVSKYDDHIFKGCVGFPSYYRIRIICSYNK